MKLAFYVGHYDSAYDHYTIPVERSQSMKGISNAVGGLALGLRRAGHEVTIISQGPETVAFDEHGITVRVFPVSTHRLPFQVAPGLFTWLEGEKRELDTLILNGIFDTSLPPLGRYARREGLPYIVSSHAPYHPNMLRKHKWRKLLYWYLVEKPLLQGAAAVQILSSAHRSFLVEQGIDRPVIVVPNGIDVESSPLRTKERGARDDRLLIGYLGRIDSWHKGLDLLIDAAGRVRSLLPGFSLVIQGQASEDSVRLARLVKHLGLESVVSFVPPTYGDPVDTISEWDVFIAPSRFDGFPITILEAMAAERPVICSTEAGVAEHVRAAASGIVVEPTPECIANAILRIAGMRNEWTTMGVAGRTYVREHLNWDRIARDAEREYASLIRTQSREPVRMARSRASNRRVGI